MGWNYCILLPVFLTSILGTMAAEHSQLQAVLKGNGQLTKDLYGILSREPGNVFFSPISVHSVLSMAGQGAAGKTKDDLTRALAVPNLQVAAEGYQEVMQRLNSAENITLHIANKVYVMQGYTLNPDFNSIVTKQFLSESQNVNFAESTEAAKTINTWVEKKTNEKIKDLISADSLDVDTRLVLVNAIYFKGQWQDKFDPKLTKTEKFYTNDKDTIDVEMMHTTKKFFYKEDDKLKAKVLELPYSNGDFSMIIILPNERNGIAELEKKLAETDLTKITEDMYKPEVIVSLPKFKIETTMDLKDTLIELGLGEMFGSRADFSNMLTSPEPLAVSKVIQKAFIEVNEEGAEAAAATGVTMMMYSLITRPTPIFQADHPFILKLIYKGNDGKTDLFTGRIVNPV